MNELQALDERYRAGRAAIRACLNLILAAGLLAGLIALPVQAGSITGGVDFIGVNAWMETDPIEGRTALLGLRLFFLPTMEFSGGSCYSLPGVGLMAGTRLYLGTEVFAQVLAVAGAAYHSCWGQVDFGGYGPVTVYWDAWSYAGDMLIGWGVKRLFSAFGSPKDNIFEVYLGGGIEVGGAVMGEHATFAVGPVLYIRLGLGHEWGRPLSKEVN